MKVEIIHRHIIGFEHGSDDADDIAKLLYDGDVVDFDVHEIFDYCPLCGERLLKTRSFVRDENS